MSAPTTRPPEQSEMPANGGQPAFVVYVAERLATAKYLRGVRHFAEMAAAIETGNGSNNAGETGSGPFEVPHKVAIGSVSFARNEVTFTPNGAASETGSVVLVNTRNLAQRIDLTAATGLVYVSDVYQYEGEMTSED